MMSQLGRGIERALKSFKSEGVILQSVMCATCKKEINAESYVYLHDRKAFHHFGCQDWT